MLVLTRRADDSVIFPELGIRITLIKVKGKTVRLGIDAPRDVRVIRNELMEHSAESEREHESLECVTR